LDFLSGIIKNLLTVFYDLTVSAGIPSYGLAIILMTIAIKMLLYPLTVKQVKSMKAMQDIQPKMKALQEKYKDNKEKLSKEMAELYKTAGVNPVAGCLPLIVQMPILIAIFYAIREYEYVGDTGFLWLHSLTFVDPTKEASFTNPSDPFYILPILSALTTYIQQKQTTADVSNAQNKMMMVFMPIFIGYITITFPAGLGIYWVVGNLVQIAQQWWMYRKPAVVQGEAK
jgi:YidC/Oxa1 family membrane protein insertase